MDQPNRRADGVAQYLERAILEGQFKRGERLPAERDLAARWGISRPTVREGIGLLVAKGLLIRRQGDGTYINSQTDQKMAEIWEDMARRHPDIQGDLIEFRHMLECKTAELAAERFNEEDRELLLSAWAEVDAAYEGSERTRQIRADLAFHRAIADAAHNPVFSYLLVSLIKLLAEHVKVSIAGLAPDSATARQLRSQHRAVLDAILAGDSAQAGLAASSHMEFVRTRLNDIQPAQSRPSRSAGRAT
ncbi:FadR family transcriptional regulator [Solimonas sp. K1W22B-7]|uniref:FadR/GntR family transcriptional regulator n=1 Tax=Solimonas sp. K1W22B-7 TaxID=2303331 RepID=UPI000E32E879|nr:FadR/GntR family transcriptional regulator [Solimonas sp. K1W22B-7]AXQ31848.1 FadR family transcriptional regulator [Solimonas sp. K1W22B-7]